MKFFLFAAKKIIAVFLKPVGLVLLLWALGGYWWLRRPEKRRGPILVVLAGLVLLVLSMPVTGKYLMGTLETRAGPYAEPGQLKQAGVKYIVVLGGGQQQGELTPADRLGTSSVLRVLEGIRLWREIPEAKLIFSGGGYKTRVSEAQAMADLAVFLGIPREALILEKASWDTEDQARILAEKLNDKPFALVTSAVHMPRSLMVFRSLGTSPRPAPADFRSQTDGGFRYGLFLPGKGLDQSTSAIHEIIGMIWYKVKGY